MRAIHQINPKNGQPRYVYSHTAPERLTNGVLNVALQAGMYTVCVAMSFKDTLSILRPTSTSVLEDNKQLEADVPEIGQRAAYDQTIAAAPKTARALLASPYAPLRGAGMLLAATTQAARDARLSH
jgi:hypothetical protein